MSSDGTANGDIDWALFSPAAYAPHHYIGVDCHDVAIARRIITTLERLSGDYRSLTEIGAGGVLRTACLAAPLLMPGSPITLTDVAEPQLAATRLAVEQVQQGRPGYWAAHEAAMTAVNSRWANALATVCRKPTIRRYNVLQAPLGTSSIRIEGHCLCSLSARPDEYNHAVSNFYGGMQTGDVAIRLFDIGSTGYNVGDVWFPGYPTDELEVSNQAESMGLVVLDSFRMPYQKRTDSNAASSTLSALGGAIMVKP